MVLWCIGPLTEVEYYGSTPRLDRGLRRIIKKLFISYIVLVVVVVNSVIVAIVIIIIRLDEQECIKFASSFYLVSTNYETFICLVKYFNSITRS